MCGIVGYVGFRSAQEILVEGLRRLEYRGYDSSGIATMNRGYLIKLDQLWTPIVKEFAALP